jgi:hypothetical protein
MWKVLLLLLALGVVFIILLRVLERWSGQAKPARPKRELEDEAEDAPSGEERLDERIEELVAEVSGPDAERARESASKLLMIGPGVLSRMLAEFLRTERGRRQHEMAVVARRFEDTLTAFGPVAIRPCLELMVAEKGSFEAYRGIRTVLTGIGEAAARPVVDAVPWLSEEGLYARAVFLLEALGPGAASAILRAVETSDGRAREIASDLLLDFARFHPESVRVRFAQAFTASTARRGVAAAPEVRATLLAALRRVGVLPADAAFLGAALRDEDPRVRRQAWLAVAEAADAGPVAELPPDPDPAAAAAQIYARDRLGLPPAAVEGAGQVAVAQAGVRARAGDAAALADLDRALLEGPLESRQEAAQALAHAGGEEAGRILARGLVQTPVPILAVVAQALGHTRSQAAVGPLFDLWEERGGNAVRRAITALGEAAVPKLLEYVSRRNPRLMEPAALALGDLGVAARRPLLDLLRECRPEDPALFAVELSLQAQGPAAVEDILPLLDAPAAHVVEVAVWILAQIGDPRAAEPLFRHLDRVEDRYPVIDFVRRGPEDVRAAARHFLEANPDHPDAEVLRQAAG